MWFKPFGAKLPKNTDEFPSLDAFLYGSLNTLSDKTIQEVIDELDNRNDILKYDSKEGAIDGDSFIKIKKIYF
jgi:hypothetical protein